MLSRVFLLVALLVFGVTTVFADYPEAPVARLRAAHYVIDAPNVDVYIDGEVVFEDAAFLTTTPYVSLEEGAHTLTVVPAGEALDAPVIDPVEIEVVGGHDYALALIRQVADESITSTFVDETELVAQDKSDDVEASYAVLLHGISDGPAVDFFLDGERLIENLEFGGYAPVAVTVEPHDIVVSFAGQPDEIVFQNSGETPPAVDFLLFTVMVGSYPDALDVTGAVTALPKGDMQSVLSSIEAYF